MAARSSPLDRSRDLAAGGSAGADWILWLLGFSICVAGIAAIFSATHGNLQSGASSFTFVRKQVTWLVLSLLIGVVISKVDYHRVLQHHWLIYFVNLVLLLAVLKLGNHEVKGAQRWISLGGFGLQPSELAKLATAITLAAYLSLHQQSIKRLPTVLTSLGHTLVPVAIIFKQPDLGTALVILTIWLAVVYVAGAEVRHLAALALFAATVFSALWGVGGIKQYQKDRFRVFLNSSVDPRGVGYHVTQAMDAIGSGKLWGKGYLRGTQGQLGYIPEQHTDFIFTVIGEEFGFAGSAVLVAMYLLFLLRVSAIALGAADPQGRMLSCGIAAMFLYHIVVNLGMTVGVMPVTGVPLPFMSYGGSSLIVSFAAIGLLQSVRGQHPRLVL